MTHQPRVSVTIPTHNGARFLAKAIESVLSQDFDDYELVVCDNASTDSTPEICRSFTHPRVRYLRWDDKATQAGSFNRCLQVARGEMQTILHADDMFLPGFLRDRVSRFDANPALGYVFGAVHIVNAAGVTLETKAPWADDRRFAPGELVDVLLTGCIVSPPTFMARTSAIRTVGDFRTDLTWGHDWDWSIRLAERHPVEYGARPLAVYRVHDASGTAEVLQAAANGAQERRIIVETLGRLSDGSAADRERRRRTYISLSRRHMYFAAQALLESRRNVAVNNLWYAVRADAGMLLKPTFLALLLGTVAPAGLYSRYRHARNALGRA
ncbi:MAG: glycosyltransferase [Acidobacteria bacterium]|nr:glycosyltransferase [Acidobacteriota bacterium]